MSGINRLDMFPSHTNQVDIEAQVIAADKGFNLLRVQSEGLKMRLNVVKKKRLTLARNIEEMFQDAFFSIAKAKFLEVDFKPAIVIGPDSAKAWIQIKNLKTYGMILPKLKPVFQNSESLPFTGLSDGGRQVKIIRKKFQDLLKTITIMASLDLSIKVLDLALHANSIRLNSLELVTIPRLRNTAAYIREALEEQTREEFFRFKHLRCKRNVIDKSTPRDSISKPKNETERDDKNVSYEKHIPLPLLIFMKKKCSSAAQTIITGHFPGSKEFISPTDSITSGDFPVAMKRSSFNVWKRNIMVPKREVIKEEADTMQKPHMKRKDAFTFLSFMGSDDSVFSPLNKQAIGAQTIITGRFPSDSESTLSSINQYFSVQSQQECKSESESKEKAKKK